MSKHRHEQVIMDIALLSKSERIAALAQLRRDGIGQSNATILAGGGSSTDLVCERKCEGEKVICSRCGGVLKKKILLPALQESLPSIRCYPP